MAESTLKKIKEDFKSAVKDYLGAIAKDFDAPEGDDSVRQPYKKRIVKIFRTVPRRLKLSGINFLLRETIQPMGDSLLTQFRCREVAELESKLTKIREAENGAHKYRF